MKALTGVDATFLHLETAHTPMHIASLSLFDLPPGYRRDFYADVNRELARRLHRVPIFHRKLAQMPLQFANPVWVEVPRWSGVSQPAAGRHLPDVARTLGGMFGAPAQPAGQRALGENLVFGPHTPLNVQITAERGFAAVSLPQERLQALAAQHGVTLNDIVLALRSGALRRYLAHRGGIPKKPLTAAMPISLRAASDAEYTIRATMPLVCLHTQIADPRPRRARAEAA